MANGITDLGNNLGYIYVVEAGDTSKFITSERNTPTGARNAKIIAVQAAALSLNKRAYGSITVSSVTGSGNVTAVTINGVNQINANIAYASGAGATTTLATDIAAGINSFTPGSGFDYIAVAIDNVVYVYAPIDAGADPNGFAITVSNTGNLTTSQVDFNYGSANDTIYDTETGFRFYLDANYGSSAAVPGVIGVSAIEISDYIIPRGLNAAFDRQAKTIASGSVSVTRKSAITILDVDTQAAAASDDLDNIVFGDASDGDILYLRGANASRIVTVTATGNINRVNSFDTAGNDTQLVLMYLDGEFWEISRSGGNYVPTAAANRSAGFPLLTSSAYGRATIAPANNTTATITPNSSKNVQRVSGSATLSTGNYTVDIVTTGAINGDEFRIAYYGTVTVGAFDVVIEGVTLTDAEALTGGVILDFIYDSGWQLVGKYYDMSVYLTQSANIGDAQITASKLDSNVGYEILTFPVSFETGEQANNFIQMPYSGTVTFIYATVTKAIAGTDSATITPKDDSGATMTDGVITFSASDPLNTSVPATPTANNTFSASDTLRFTTAKTTAGGKALVTIHILRT